jgi:hypothetical protein
MSLQVIHCDTCHPGPAPTGTAQRLNGSQEAVRDYSMGAIIGS